MANELTEKQVTSLEMVKNRLNEAIFIPIKELKFEQADDFLDDAELSILRLLKGAGPERIRKGIAFTAKMLGCREPDSFTYKGFEKLLSDIPADLWERGVLKLLETHTFCKIPTPAEFIEPIRSEWVERKILLSKIEFHRNRLKLSDNLNHKKLNKIKMLE